MDKNKIIIVDEDDNQIGTGEKLAVHQKGLLHRAFSIFVFNKKGELMLQRRALSKYHSPGLWSNTCCSHPAPGEDTLAAAHRRLKEEMGFDCELREKFSFIYKTKLGDLTEHEFDHVLFGQFDGEPVINKDEVEDWEWMRLEYLKEELHNKPELYSYWLKVVLDKI